MASRAAAALRAQLLSLLILWTATAARGEPCPDGASFHSVAASANASGQWEATLLLEKDSRLFRRAEDVRLDVRPAAWLCGSVRTVAMTVELQGPPHSNFITPTSAPATTTASPQPPPDLGYTEVPGIGFYKVHQKKVNWKDAKTVCEAEGAHLVIINSETEAAAVRDLLQPQAQWLTKTLHAGFFATSTDYFTTHGVPLRNTSYANWAPGEPKHVDICGSIDHSALLGDAYCSWNVKRSFLCEFGRAQHGVSQLTPGAGQPALPPKASVYPAADARNWEIREGGHAYTVHLENASWAEANSACAAEGAHLLVVGSEEEANLLEGYIRPHLSAIAIRYELYVGVFSQSHFVTIFGFPLSTSGYLHWAEGEPNNHLCVVAHHDLSLAGVGCALKTGFICEKISDASL